MQKVDRLDNLDFLRGLAAFLVLAGHARSYIFRSFGELAHVGPQTKVFYFLTGFGHQAVVVFFALSGFLVGGKALNDMLNKRFCWYPYILRRVTRLWVVMIPALLLTLLFDNFGQYLTHGNGYDGHYYDIFCSGPKGPAGVDNSFLTFLCNIGFLQTIAVPVFGSNGPLWSLANEFWYYIIFPLAAWAVLADTKWVARAIAISMFVALGVLLPMWLLEEGAIWVAGAGAAWCTRRRALTPLLRANGARIGVIVLLLSALVLSKLRADIVGDFELGMAVAVALPFFATLPNWRAKYSAFARASSELSYTLYLTHFPLLTLIALTAFGPHRAPQAFMAPSSMWARFCLRPVGRQPFGGASNVILTGSITG